MKLGATDFEELAVKLNTIFTERFLVLKGYAGSITLKAGELAEQKKTGETFTLPAAATANQVIGVFNTVASCKVTTSGGAKIFGDVLSTAGVATITLAEMQHVVLQSNGADWLIVAGEPYGRTISWGQVSSAGAIFTGGSGSGDWTVAKTGTGKYEIKWSAARPSANYIATVGNSAGSFGFVTSALTETTKFEVVTRSPANVAADLDFNFIVIAK